MAYIPKIYKCSSRQIQVNIVIREIIKNSYHNVEIHIPIAPLKFNYFKAIKQVFKIDKLKFIKNKETYSICIHNDFNKEKINFYIIDNISDKDKFIYKEDEEHEIVYLSEEYNSSQGIDTNLLEHDKNYSYIHEVHNIKKENIKVVHLNNSKIKICFFRLMKISEKEIDIMSPWLREDICNDEFMNIIEAKLFNGVKVKIAYGIRQHKTDKETDKVAKKLLDQFGMYRNFDLNKGNTHYKCLLIDDKYSLCGSINFLSRKGEFIECNDKATEGADLIISNKNTEEKRKIYFNF